MIVPASLQSGCTYFANYFLVVFAIVRTRFVWKKIFGKSQGKVKNLSLNSIKRFKNKIKINQNRIELNLSFYRALVPD